MSPSPLFCEPTVVIPGESSKESVPPPGSPDHPENWEERFSRSAVSTWLKEHGSEVQGAKLLNCRKRGMALCCLNGHRWGVRIRCDLRICPDCLKRLGKKVWDIRARDMNSISRGKAGWSWKMLTLTLRTDGEAWNKESLRGRIKKIWECARKLFKDFYLIHSMSGLVGVTEVGKNGNVHIHCIVWGPFVAQATLSQRWSDLTKDSKIVDIRKVRGSLKGALAYVGKYLAKVPGFADPEHFGVYLQAITGHRRIHTFGVLIRSEEPELKPGLVCLHCGLGLQVDHVFRDAWRYPPWEWILAGIDGIEPLTSIKTNV